MTKKYFKIYLEDSKSFFICPLGIYVNGELKKMLSRGELGVKYDCEVVEMSEEEYLKITAMNIKMVM